MSDFIHRAFMIIGVLLFLVTTTILIQGEINTDKYLSINIINLAYQWIMWRIS